MVKKSNIVIMLLSIVFILSIKPIDAYADENTMNVSVDIVWKDSNNIHNTRPDGIEMWLTVDNDKAYGSGTINVYDTSFVFEDVSKGDESEDYNYDLEVVGVSANVYDCDIVKYGVNKFVVVYTLKVKNGDNGEIIIPVPGDEAYPEDGDRRQPEIIAEDNNYLSQNNQNRTSDEIMTENSDGVDTLDDTPKTSDEFNYGLYLGIAIVAFVAMVGIGSYCLIRKKKVINDVEEFKYVVNGDEGDSGVTLTKNEDKGEEDKDSVRYNNSDKE